MADHDINIILRARDLASRTIKGVNSELSKTAKLNKHLGTTASNLKTIGVVGGGIAIAGLAASVKEASDLNEEVNKSKVVFGEASTAILAWSKTTAQSAGLAQSESLGASAAFGNMFHTVGLANGESADMSKRMVMLAADMASFNNEDPSEMLDRLRSGLAGEAEPLRRFGVLLSEARVKQEAVNMGLTDGKRALTEQEKVQARYSLILKDTTVQQGDFERTSDSLANVQRRLKASLRDTGATIGTALLPQMEKVAIRLNDLIAAKQPEIQALAKELPAVFDEAIKFAEGIPWDAVQDTFVLMGQGAKAALTLFNSMPSWVKTAVLTGWGLNKLTGGLITDLGKGLIKGVLGMNAGVVNIKAGVVNGVGGPGIPGGGGGAGNRLGGLNLLRDLGKVFIPAAILSEGLIISGQSISEFAAENNRLAKAGLNEAEIEAVKFYRSTAQEQQLAFKRLGRMPSKADYDSGVAKLEGALKSGGAGGAPGAFRPGAGPGGAPGAFRSSSSTPGRVTDPGVLAATTGMKTAVVTAVQNARSIASRENSAQRAELQTIRGLTLAQTAAGAANSIAEVFATARAAIASTNAGLTAAAATNSGTSRIVAAIYAARPIVQSTTVVKTTTVNNRYGENGGSRQSDWSPTH